MFDPSKLRDDEVEPAKRSLIEPHAEEVVRGLTAAGPSKVLISTRLMLDALEGRFGQRMPGVGHVRLPGLTDADTVTLLARLGVHGDERAITGFFGRLANHPLLVGVVAGMLRDYRPDPGGFGRWLADPNAGGALALPDMDLTQRRAHILDAALAGLPPAHRRLLGWISVLAGAVDWATLEAINPFRPEPPASVQTDFRQLGPEPVPSDYPQLMSAEDRPASQDVEADGRTWQEVRDTRQAYETRLHAQNQRDMEKLAAWRSSEAVARAKAQLDLALQDLEDRGLLWWDRPSNSYDLHPIVRAYVHDQLENADRVQANERIRDHFQALPPEDPDSAASVEDLRRTITIFRALIDIGRLDDASTLWQRTLGNVLVVGLGAYATVVELLTPLAIHGSFGVRGYLSIAYRFLGRWEEAINHETGILTDALHAEDVFETNQSLTRLEVRLSLIGAEVSASRCLELRGALVTAADHDEAIVSLVSARGMQAAHRGQVGQALALLNEAEELGAPAFLPWAEGDIRLTRLPWRWSRTGHSPRTSSQPRNATCIPGRIATTWQDSGMNF